MNALLIYPKYPDSFWSFKHALRQKESVEKIISEFIKNKVKIIAGGSLFSQEYGNFPQIDHFILNEAKITLFRRPGLLVDAITFSIYGYHYRKVFGLSVS